MKSMKNHYESKPISANKVKYIVKYKSNKKNAKNVHKLKIRLSNLNTKGKSMNNKYAY